MTHPLNDEELCEQIIALSQELHPAPGATEHIRMLLAYILEACGRGLWGERLQLVDLAEGWRTSELDSGQN